MAAAERNVLIIAAYAAMYKRAVCQIRPFWMCILTYYRSHEKATDVCWTKEFFFDYFQALRTQTPTPLLISACVAKKKGNATQQEPEKGTWPSSFLDTPRPCGRKLV